MSFTLIPHTPTCSWTHKHTKLHQHTHILTPKTLHRYQDYHIVTDTPWNIIKIYTVCVSLFLFLFLCVCVFVLGVNGFSHAKSCKPENTDHKLPTSISNQQPHKEPIHTHMQRHQATRRTSCCSVMRVHNQTLCGLNKWCPQTHIWQGHWKQAATENTTQPDTLNSLNKCLMLPLWYLPLHHCHL